MSLRAQRGNRMLYRAACFRAIATLAYNDAIVSY